MGSVVGTHRLISGILFMSAIFTPVAIKQDPAEEFGAKNRKWPFSWPLSDLSEIMIYVAYKGNKSTHFSLLPFFGLVNLGQVTGCVR